MIDLYFWATANGYKPLIALEELNLPYVIRPINILKGEQFDPAFLAVAPNNRIPAIVDDAPGIGPATVSLFESGAILTYLAEKADALHGADRAGWFEVQQWLHWQIGGLGPNMGQAGHFHVFAAEDVPYAKARFIAETERLIGVMERRLEHREYLAGPYSIADIACYPWLHVHTMLPLSLAAYPRVGAWLAAISKRPAVKRAYEIGATFAGTPVLDEAARKVLFGRRTAPT